MHRSRQLRLFRVVAFVMVVISLVACSQVATPASIPKATNIPTVPTAPLANIPAAPSRVPQGALVSLPVDAANRLNSVAATNGLKARPLALQHTVFYAFPDSGVASLLTPTEQGPGMTAGDLVKNPKAIENVSLGGLTVILQTNNLLPPDDYVITLAPDRESVLFVGAKTQARFPAVIRSLALPVPRPVALITSSQMCLAWEATQICAKVETPLRLDLKDQLTAAINRLDVPPAAIALNRAIPDVEGRGMLDICAKALGQTPPAYASCQATVLAAPTIEDGAFPAPPEKGKITAIGVLLALNAIKDDVYRNPELTLSVGELPGGPYKTFEVLLSGEEPAPGKPINTRVRQSGPAGDFYLPAVSGGVIIGTAISGSGPANEQEAVIVNLWISGRCYFKAWQCPWL